ncbi:hypothetical protein Hanom_Chr13g01195841 [Helianthus anomalus]
MPISSDMIIDSIANATPPLSTARIPRVPEMVKEIHDYQKYYVPKVVSIGPYHFGTPKLEYVEKLKPIYTMKLVAGNREILRRLYEKLGEPGMMRDLRSFYEENSTTTFNDEVVFVHQDLFMLENQIPFKVLNEVMSLMGDGRFDKINSFISGNILAPRYLKRMWYEGILCIPDDRRYREERDLELTGDKEPDHLIHILHCTLTKHEEAPSYDSQCQFTFPNVNELLEVGVSFKPSNTKSLAHVKFSKVSWVSKLVSWMSVHVELPPIMMDDSTKPMLLNLIAFERCLCSTDDSWVTSYVCLLDSLIDDAADVKVLRKAGVLLNGLGRDQNIANLLHEIGTDLVPSSLAYLRAKRMIQHLYDSIKDTTVSELKHWYIKDHLHLYQFVECPKGKCDDLCVLLKRNHHL